MTARDLFRPRGRSAAGRRPRRTDPAAMTALARSEYRNDPSVQLSKSRSEVHARLILQQHG